MRVPLSWLRDYVELPEDVQRVAEMLAQLGFPVEAIEQRPALTGIVVGRITRLEKHPDADRLLVGHVEIGGAEELQIVTAAENVAAGQRIAVATIGAQLPQLRIERRKMRGVESAGMMISADELALPAEWFEDGILQLDADAPLGANVVELFRLTDPVLDVEITGNRPDAMSVIGLARELAAYQGLPLRLPDLGQPRISGTSKASISIETPDCRRFVAQIFSNVRGGTAPLWMRIRLALAGQRPIDRIVDISNYVMLETGQPLHFYDAGKIPNEHLIVRDARAGETLVALDGATYRLEPHDLVIASERGAEGLAGIKGGKRAEVSPQTGSIILESANFAGARIRRTANRLALRTEASIRHQKALPPALAEIGAARAAQLLAAGGAETHPPVSLPAGPIEKPKAILFDPADVQRLLGFALPDQEIRELLDRLGFKVRAQRGKLSVVPPPWRSDVSLPADVVEEVARMAGYDRIESVLPVIRGHAISSSEYHFTQKIAFTLAALGYREIISYALSGAPSEIEVLNPLSEEQRYLRSALEPGMLRYLARVREAARAFELGRVFFLQDGQPAERLALTFGFTTEPAGDPEWRDTAFLRLKGDCARLLRQLTGSHAIEMAAGERDGLHPGKTGVFCIDEREAAILGRVDARLEASHELKLPAYLCSIRLESLPPYVLPSYSPPPKFPSTYRDLALLCDIDVAAGAIESCIRRAAGELCAGVRTFDEYRGSQIPPDKKSLAVRIVLQRPDATLTDADADRVIEAVFAELREKFGAQLRA